MNVGFIGLGKMGGPMAANVAAATDGLRVLRPRRHSVTHARWRCRRASRSPISPAVAATVLISVPDGSATLAVAEAIVAADGSVVDTLIDLSTIGPAAAARGGHSCSQSVGVTYCDGPVSGGAAGARAATISLMFSGPAERAWRLIGRCSNRSPATSSMSVTAPARVRR